ncbi:hypothetical protein PGT21_002513 [Puccinia graminis f. sp. tritici]|uniref:Uncharacterized protein n=1 Tax=Puccinia graminis f. sp. tritici TaxID=56615 RepID=A0A5B0PLY6_PUCGR|nr:hypothetical protein PGT21_002513 [Puccinia graminis f. sp. tritici]
MSPGTGTGRDCEATLPIFDHPDRPYHLASQDPLARPKTAARRSYFQVPHMLWSSLYHLLCDWVKGFALVNTRAGPIIRNRSRLLLDSRTNPVETAHSGIIGPKTSSHLDEDLSRLRGTRLGTVGGGSAGCLLPLGPGSCRFSAIRGERVLEGLLLRSLNSIRTTLGLAKPPRRVVWVISLVADRFNWKAGITLGSYGSRGLIDVLQSVLNPTVSDDCELLLRLLLYQLYCVPFSGQ